MKPFSFAALALACAFAPAAAAEREYQPIQSISYDLGSKAMSGYYVKTGAHCLVTLMIAEKSDPGQPSTATAARMRLLLDPGEVAGLDSEEGQSLNFTCGQDAAKLIVNDGARDKMIDLQTRWLRKIAEDE